MSSSRPVRIHCYVPLLAVLSLVLLSCGGPSIPKNLERAMGYIEYSLQPSNLARTSFPVVLPDGTPKQYVSWMFSAMGKADWPPTDESAVMEFGSADMVPSGIPLLPDDVAFVHSRPDTSAKNQVVVKWDDARGVVIAEAYLDPNGQPVEVREFPLPHVTSTNEAARLAAQDNLGLGMSYQAF